MSTIVKPIPHTVDLNEPVKKTYIDTLLATEDNLAHRFDITLNQGGQAVAMPSGAAVTAYFIRYSDNATVPITGGAVNGNVASVTLTRACYNKPGQFALIIKVSGGGIVNTVFYGEGTVYTSSTDKVVNDETIVPSMADMLAMIDQLSEQIVDYRTAVNLLDNSNFEIAQAGYNGMHGKTQYACDRWESYSVTVEKTNSGLVAQSSSAYGHIKQVQNVLVGKPVTFAAKFSEAHKCQILVMSEYLERNYGGSTNCNENGIICMTIIPQEDSLAFLIYPYFDGSNTGSGTIEWAALYEGEYTAETLPPYVPKGYANELLNCQISEHGSFVTKVTVESQTISDSGYLRIPDFNSLKHVLLPGVDTSGQGYALIPIVNQGYRVVQFDETGVSVVVNKTISYEYCYI